MTLQDLTENRDRIIKNIKRQVVYSNANDAVKGVMNKMVAFLGREEYSAMTATKANIDKLTAVCIKSYIKTGMNASITQEWLNHIEEKRNSELPSSLQR